MPVRTHGGSAPGRNGAIGNRARRVGHLRRHQADRCTRVHPRSASRRRLRDRVIPLARPLSIGPRSPPGLDRHRQRAANPGELMTKPRVMFLCTGHCYLSCPNQTTWAAGSSKCQVCGGGIPLFAIIIIGFVVFAIIRGFFGGGRGGGGGRRGGIGSDWLLWAILFGSGRGGGWDSFGGDRGSSWGGGGDSGGGGGDFGGFGGGGDFGGGGGSDSW